MALKHFSGFLLRERQTRQDLLNSSILLACRAIRHAYSVSVGLSMAELFGQDVRIMLSAIEGREKACEASSR